MILRRVALLTAALFAVFALLSSIFAAPKDFIPDVVFNGSSLSGLRQIGAATWKAESGEITGTPSSVEGGWLVFDKGYQDIQFYSDFRCSASCNAGVLLRAAKTESGGLKGTYISLAEGDTDAYELELSADGKDVSRKKLDRASAQFSRIATGPQSNGNSQVPGFARPAPTVAEYQAEQTQAAARGQAGGRGGAQAAGRGGVAGAAGRGGAGRGGASLPANEWNSIDVIVDMDMVWTALNGRRGWE